MTIKMEDWQTLLEGDPVAQLKVFNIVLARKLRESEAELATTKAALQAKSVSTVDAEPVPAL